MLPINLATHEVVITPIDMDETSHPKPPDERDGWHLWSWRDVPNTFSTQTWAMCMWVRVRNGKAGT